MKWIFLLNIFLFSFFGGCTENKKVKVAKGTKVSEKEYERDRKFLQYTVEQFVKQKHKGYSVNIYENSTIHVDTILYSPDTLKLFGLIILEKERGQEGDPFQGRGVIAYRDSLTDYWKVYPVTDFGVSWTDYQGASNVLRRSYFYELKGKKDNQKNEFKYTPLEKGFWTDLYFKKGYDVDSLYYFQTELNRNVPTLKRKKDAVIPLLEIDYPKELLKQFEKQ